jgi:hypothetical protein
MRTFSNKIQNLRCTCCVVSLYLGCTSYVSMWTCPESTQLVINSRAMVSEWTIVSRTRVVRGKLIGI